MIKKESILDNKHNLSSEKMRISLIIPFFNEEESLLKTLCAINSQTHKAEEVIFVDSGSTDNSKKIITEYSKLHQELNIKVLFSGKMSPSTSINMGIKNSKFELIAYTDCDLKIPENWLKSNLDSLKKNDSQIVSIKFYTSGEGVIDESFVAHTYGYKSFSSPLTGSLMYKSVIEQIGYLLPNVRANYDIDFYAKLKKNRIKRSINPNVIIKYFGINYCNSFNLGIFKIIKYSEGAWKVKSDKKPYLYIIFTILFILSIFMNFGMLFLLLYIFLRGFLIPIFKSSHKILFNIPVLLTLPLTGIMIDTSRVIGYLYIHKLFFSNKLNYDC